MRFWDSSAIVPLCVAEPMSSELEALLEKDRDVLAWWATGLECLSALSRRERLGPVPPIAAAAARARLTQLSRAWDEVDPVEAVRRTASRLLRTHDLRAGDALQLAAAIAGADGDPSLLGFVCLDDRLRIAAELEGFPVEPSFT